MATLHFLTFNIGLDGAPGDSVQTRAINAQTTIIRALHHLGLLSASIESNVVASDSEPTLILECTIDGFAWRQNQWRKLLFAALRAVSSKLNQDCIAMLDRPTGRGWLIGERAAQWGAFNPDMFFTLTGDRVTNYLSPAVVKATIETEGAESILVLVDAAGEAITVARGSRRRMLSRLEHVAATYWLNVEGDTATQWHPAN